MNAPLLPPALDQLSPLTRELLQQWWGEPITPELMREIVDPCQSRWHPKEPDSPTRA